LKPQYIVLSIYKYTLYIDNAINEI